MNRVDIRITNAEVLTMNSFREILKGAEVHIHGSQITYVGPSQGAPLTAASETIDAKNCLVLPGLINCHTHVPMTLFRGLADDLPLMKWLNEYIFPVEKEMDPEFVYIGALIGILEILLSGTTTFCDMYLFEESVLKAAIEAKVRCVLGEVLYDFPSPNYGPIEKGFEYTKMLIERHSENPLVRFAVMPHATFTCSEGLLKTAKEISDEYRVPIVIHVAETEAEVDTIRKKAQKTPVRYLKDLGILGEKTIAVHCVHLTDEDIHDLKETNTKVVFNPESNMKLASGIPRVREIRQAGISCGIGTDGAASNNNLDLLEEMDTLAKLTKLRYQDPSSLTAKEVLEMATIEGARVLGMESIIGSIEVGKKADIIIIDMDGPHLIPSYDPYSTLVYSARGSDVRDVIVDGRIVVRDRKPLTLDWEAIQKEGEKMAERIRTRLGK